MFSLTMIALLLIALAALSQGAVLRSVPTIDNPCQGDTTSTGTPVYLPIKDQIQLTITAANNADTTSQTFKQALVSMMSVLTESDTNGLDGPLQNVHGLSMAVGEPAVSASNNVTSLQQDYQDISTYIMYLQFFKTLQTATDNGQFTEGIDNVKNQFYAWLCRIDTTLRAQNKPMTQFVDNSAVNADVKTYATNGDKKNRYSLYYVAMKNAHDCIQNKNLKWATFLQTLN
ncbi:unnamed protein product [Candidula unifasciata]|uniref:Uncharacterized protein n=1 Tax=Candidula unifasciata TaxID=100452 RepID=A0A8S3Z598_9EUPU|nr:unnamed protein product [Candidula unifasciata]